MAKYFARGSSEAFLSTNWQGIAGIVDYPMSVFCWFTADFTFTVNSGEWNLFTFFEQATTDNWSHMRIDDQTGDLGKLQGVHRRSDNYLIFAYKTTNVCVTGNDFWNSALNVIQPNDVGNSIVLLNGDTTGAYNGPSNFTTTSTVNISDTDRLSIARFQNQTTVQDYFHGSIAWLTFWDVALTLEEGVALSQGVNPLTIRPESIKVCYPFDKALEADGELFPILWTGGNTDNSYSQIGTPFNTELQPPVEGFPLKKQDTYATVHDIPLDDGVIVPHNFGQELFAGTFDFNSSTDLYMSLHTNALTPTSTMSYWSEVSSTEIVGAGYTASGNLLANCSVTSLSPSSAFISDDPKWPSLTMTSGRYAVVWKRESTPETSPLISIHPFTETTVTTENMKVLVPSTGLVSIS